MIERELKLSLPAGSVDAAREYFRELTGADGEPIELANIYFDTPELSLAAARAALRLRRTPDGWLQTFKSGGGASGGLHRRHEIEVPVPGERLDVPALLEAQSNTLDPGGEPPALAVLRDATDRLTPLFRTDFTRTLWLLDWQHATVEVALDRGSVTATVNGQARATPICEIELELKEGDEAALHALADAVSARVPGVHPDDVSKAQRGLQLRET
jgi:inorganic triphosphatase YgiF